MKGDKTVNMEGNQTFNVASPMQIRAVFSCLQCFCRFSVCFCLMFLKIVFPKQMIKKKKKKKKS